MYGVLARPAGFDFEGTGRRLGGHGHKVAEDLRLLQQVVEALGAVQDDLLVELVALALRRRRRPRRRLLARLLHPQGNNERKCHQFVPGRAKQAYVLQCRRKISLGRTGQ